MIFQEEFVEIAEMFWKGAEGPYHSGSMEPHLLGYPG